jgi:ABC-type spermidine/putrescine transport system permease subunit II
MSETPINPPPLPTAQDAAAEAKALRKQRQTIVVVSVVAVVILLLIVFVGLGLWQQPATDTSKVRDIFIIFMALESLIIGAALVVLIVQVASLINLLNNEVKPMLEATNETIATLRGTTEFLSENLVEPVVKLNSYVAGLQKMLEIFNLKK